MNILAVKTFNALGYVIAIAMILVSAVAVVAFCVVWRPVQLIRERMSI